MWITDKQRDNLVTLADYLVKNAAKVHYAEIRPMATASIKNLAQLHRAIQSDAGITMDCSESITLMYRLCGLQDPNGLDYDGDGFTGTMLTHLPHLASFGDAHAGTLLVFGSYPGTHVCMVTRPDGTNPLLFSHGSEAGPFSIRFDQEQLAHEGEMVTLLGVESL